MAAVLEYSIPPFCDHDGVITWKHCPHLLVLWGKPTGHWWISLTKGLDIFLYQCLNKTIEQTMELLETLIWSHCNTMAVMVQPFPYSPMSSGLYHPYKSGPITDYFQESLSLHVMQDCCSVSLNLLIGHQEPISPLLYELISQILQLFVLISLWFYQANQVPICTCHDSGAVVACAKLELDWIIIFHVRIINICTNVGLLAHKPFV